MNALHVDLILCPNDTTNDDHDIYLAFDATTHQCANVAFNYQHMKGHQDKDPQLALLVEEQHNVDCNCFAKHYVLAQTTPSTDYGNPEFKVAALHLQIAGKIIC